MHDDAVVFGLIRGVFAKMFETDDVHVSSQGSVGIRYQADAEQQPKSDELVAEPVATGG